MTEVKKTLPEGLVFDKESFRVSTPVEIASYISKRLRAEKVADLGCGIGIQTINLARESGSVIAVDIDPQRLEMCKLNCESMGLDNVKYVLGDATSKEIIDEVGDVDVIHSDPSRNRVLPLSMDSLSPNPFVVYRSYKGDMCFDLPATITSDRIPHDWELEFISLRGEMKRLCAYTGNKRIYGRSAISLPSGDRIISDPKVERKVVKAERPLRYIYDVDSSIPAASLLPEFVSSLGDMSIIQEDKQRTLATSLEPIESPFLIRRFLVVNKSGSFDDLRKALSNLKIGKVYLRFNIDPSSYYEMKRSLEEKLKGEKNGYVFRFKNSFYVGLREE
ncbi:MAG: class I SAM-dependent methyltransferase [Thermoplasmatales archaeon]